MGWFKAHLILQPFERLLIPRDCAGFGFVCTAHPAAHIEIRAGGCNAVDGPKDKPDVEFFSATAIHLRQARSAVEKPTMISFQRLFILKSLI
jgi:hypothetical protein